MPARVISLFGIPVFNLF